MEEGGYGVIVVVVNQGCNCMWKGRGDYRRSSKVRMRPPMRFRKCRGGSQLTEKRFREFFILNDTSLDRNCLT